MTNIIKRTDQKIQELLVLKEKKSNILPKFQHSVNGAFLSKLVNEKREEFDKCKKEQKNLLYSVLTRATPLVPSAPAVELSLEKGL